MTDEVIEGIWRYYPSEEPIRYSEWIRGDPNAGKQGNCALIWREVDYSWVDDTCHHLFLPICELP